MTQSFRDMDQQIAKLLHMLIKVRKADLLGKKEAYIRKVHGGYRGAVISTEERAYQPQFFPLYKSHTQGNSVSEAGATDVSPFIVKFRRFTWGFALFTVAVCVYVAWPSDKPSKMDAAKAKVAAQRKGQHVPTTPQPAPQPPAPAPAASGPAPAAVAASAPVATEPYPEPYASHQLHVTGWLTMAGRVTHSFAVVRGAAQLGTVTTRDLERAGYTVQPLSECAVVIDFHGKKRTLVCDLARPQFEGGRSVDGKPQT